MINKKQIVLLVLFFVLLVVFVVVWHEYQIRQVIIYQSRKENLLNKKPTIMPADNLETNKEASISTQGLASDDAKLVEETNVDLSDIDKELDSLNQELEKLSF